MSEPHAWNTNSPEETKELAQRFAKSANPGDIFALYGDLASGKTTFVQGFCEALNVTEPVTSPTFTLINEYTGRIPVYHFDCYRLESEEELYSLGFEEYFYGDGIVLIEWADRVEGLLPNECIRLFFQHDFSGESVRQIQYKHGKEPAAV
ncbi:MAG: tRNA (adenosine(37)-N6)-threonylcarbamoyltransferase complex ATPase subunit type 1 TsaE [Candidatus Marinimicrobia bacterium]|nr:tRNA (adenosine(37)-N6)-threonylcarbamoyltransferase complex ATPase subunit type 1 TsaE [Candidatus Neomarinimicrobiota bacterium]MCF7829809.1 tRNA (adenosine(37)-N6)-threonylcarbamoyltransferase complex ATPase subunit type 1 TsaE [Candidatus Neomarinimicrobiota bacterium]MCF7881758.1 tRNA (adenosine(37)-N6)-threonylcarbamoyltransferase complex ATPase subunit type 1 TsaE [Candidatus Neomarinimicrobiota bacterium]